MKRCVYPSDLLNLLLTLTLRSAQFSDTQITLDDASIKKYYELGDKHVHYVEGLPITDVSSPCSTTKSRFIFNPDNSVCSSDSTDSSIKSAIEAAILASTDANTNIIDINVKNDCSGNGIGAKVSVTKLDGTVLCYEHTHPDEHSVFDFTLWSSVHTGNADAYKGGRANPIAQFALNGLAKLTFPSWHVIARWNTGRKENNKQAIVLLGRLGDEVAFSSLPREYQFKTMADYVGVTSTLADDGGVEVCGSPGEGERVQGAKRRVCSYVAAYTAFACSSQLPTTRVSGLGTPL